MKHCLRRLGSTLLAGLTVGLVTLGCSVDLSAPLVSGNTELSELAFRNMALVPALTKGVYQYSIVKSTNTKFNAIVTSAIHRTAFSINEVGFNKRTDYITNNMGYPTYTPVTPVLTGDTADLYGYFKIDLKAESGMTNTYTVNILGSDHDAGIGSILLTNGSSPFPEFDDGFAPYFEGEVIRGTNAYEIFSSSDFRLGARTVSPDASVYIDGAPATSGTLVPIGVADDGNWHLHTVQVVSASEKFTNTKYFKVRYISQEKNNLLTHLAIAGTAQRLKPGFYANTTNYNVIFEDVETFGLSIKKSFANQKIYLDTGTGDYGTEVAAGKIDYDVSDIPVTQGRLVRVKVVSEDSSSQKVYQISLMSFTTKPYDFDGGIKEYIKMVNVMGGFTPEMEVTGIITVREYFGYNDAPMCFFLEDANYGLYVFLQIGANPNKLDPLYQVGHKVTVRLTLGNLYYGQPEAMRYTDMRFADGGTVENQVRHSIHILPRPVFPNPTALSRMHRFEGVVKQELNPRQVGFMDTKPGALPEISDMQFHINEPVWADQMRPKLKIGASGVFYGPILWSWDKYQFELVNDQYLLLDDE